MHDDADDSPDSLCHELQSRLKSLEKDLLIAYTENEKIFALATGAQQESRNINQQLHAMKQQLRNTEEANCNAVAEFSLEQNDMARQIVKLERKVNLLTTAKVSAEDDVQMWKKIAEQDRDEYKTRARGLERTAHIAEIRLKTLLEGLDANGSTVCGHHVGNSNEYDVDEDEQVIPEISEIFETDIVSSPAVVGGSGTCLADELLSEEYQSDGEWDSVVGYRDKEEMLAEFKSVEVINDDLGDSNNSSSERKEYYSIGSQVVDDNTRLSAMVSLYGVSRGQDYDQESIVINLGQEIMERLAGLALIGAGMGWKTVKINRAEDWIVVSFP